MPVYRGAIQTISASSVKSASGNSGTLNLGALGGGGPDAAQFLLSVTAASAPTSLDIYLQHSPDAGVTWFDFGHFTQVTGSSSTQSLVWDRRSDATNAATTAVTATGDAALAAGVVIPGPIADNFFRAKWVIVGTSFTFSLIVLLDRD